MNLNEIYNKIQEIDLQGMITEISGNEHVLTQTEQTALIVTAVAGLLFCLLGLKIVRLWAAMLGFSVGAVAGFAVAQVAGGLDPGVCLIAGLVCGVILALLGAILYRVGVFLTVLISMTLFCVYVINPINWIMVLVCLMIGLVAAVLSVKFVEVITIIVTSAFGAVLAGNAVYQLLPITGQIICILICVAFGIVGVLIQLLLESRKRKKKSLKKAEAIRQEKSTENEVEKARAMMVDLDKEPEPEEDYDTDEKEDDEIEIIELDDETEE